MQADVSSSLALQANWAQASFIQKPWSYVHEVLGLNIPPCLLGACFSSPQEARELMQVWCDAEASLIQAGLEGRQRSPRVSAPICVDMP